MSTYKTESVVIRRRNFGESSLILDFYTKEYGRVEAVARSARKLKGKLKGHLELFLCSHLIFARSRNIDRIANSFTLNSFSELRKDLRVSFAAYYFCELVEKMTIAEHKDERIYHLLKECFLFLDDLENFSIERGLAKDGRECMDLLTLIVLFFQINILDLAGYSAHLQKCVFCSKKLQSEQNYFSHVFGGIICAECVSKDPGAVKLEDNAIKLLRLLQFSGGGGVEEYVSHLRKKLKDLQRVKVERALDTKLVNLLNSFIEFNIERKVKSIDFIRIL